MKFTFRVENFTRIENKLTAAIEAGPDGKPDWKTRIMCNFVTDYIDVSINNLHKNVNLVH